MRRDLSTWTDSPRRQFWHPGHQTARRKWKRWWQLWGQLPVPDRSALLQPFPTNKLSLHFSRALTERCCTHKPGLQTKKRCLELCIVAIYCSYSHTFQSHMYSKRTQKYYPRVQLFNTHTHYDYHQCGGSCHPSTQTISFAMPCLSIGWDASEGVLVEVGSRLAEHRPLMASCHLSRR